MSNKDFFRIIIKITGLYFFIKTIFTALPFQISGMDLNSDFNNKIYLILYNLIFIIFIIGILYFLIKFPDKIINLFKLDKGFENEKISITNFNSKNILLLGIFIVGGFLIIENLSSVISLSYIEIKKSNNIPNHFLENNKTNLLIDCLNLLLGFCLITFRKNIVKFFEK